MRVCERTLSARGNTSFHGKGVICRDLGRISIESLNSPFIPSGPLLYFEQVPARVICRDIFPKIYWELTRLASSLYVRGSISIIKLKRVWIVPSKSRINLQTRLGPLLKFQRRIILARLVVSGEKVGHFCR